MNLHYAVFTLRGGRLWELDGRKNFPIDHGPSSRDDLLQARCCGAFRTVGAKHYHCQRSRRAPHFFSGLNMAEQACRPGPL